MDSIMPLPENNRILIDRTALIRRFLWCFFPRMASKAFFSKDIQQAVQKHSDDTENHNGHNDPIKLEEAGKQTDTILFWLFSCRYGDRMIN